MRFTNARNKVKVEWLKKSRWRASEHTFSKNGNQLLINQGLQQQKLRASIAKTLSYQSILNACVSIYNLQPAICSKWKMLQLHWFEFVFVSLTYLHKLEANKRPCLWT